VKLEGTGTLLRVFVGESDSWHGKPLYQAIVHRARAEGLAGATVVRGIEGYGRASVIHTARILRLSEDLPVVIEIVDIDEKINAAMAWIDEMVSDGLVTRERVEVITYRSKGEDT